MNLPRTLGELRRSEFTETGRADHAVFVLGDTFPAIKMAAFRTTRRRFPQGVIEATLVDQTRAHGN